MSNGRSFCRAGAAAVTDCVGLGCQKYTAASSAPVPAWPPKTKAMSHFSPCYACANDESVLAGSRT